MKIVCLGDSFTRGFGVTRGENWVSNLKLADTEIINKGINGDTTSGMLSRFCNDVVPEKPDFVIITGCINDFIVGSPVEIAKNNYMAMVHQAFHNMIVPIIGIEPGFAPEAVRDDWSAFADFSVVLKKNQEFRLWVYEFCKTFGVPHIDFYDAFEKVRSEAAPCCSFFIDGLHLTAEGHKHIADFAAMRLKQIID